MKSAKQLFLAAVEDSTQEHWSSFLDRECGDDVELREQVQELLDAHAWKENLLDRPALAAPARDDLVAGVESVGTTIGRYKLLEKIGEGGMGAVFMAEQLEPVKRKVAVKVIKPGMDTRQCVARFEAERQALAMMDHLHIARVLDGGSTESGRPYFVMELVPGIPITDFCDQEKFTPRQRLTLLIDVCRAVQHAHQRGIIHRDLKPSNILVTLHDGTPVVKVIDFGVAKAINQELTQRTLFTNFKHMIGTPLYMSPEQAALSGLDVDTRSDVYSLGVLLYELITGSTPFEKEALRQAGFDEMRRIIREDEPPRPSARLSTMQAEALSTICERRRSDPRSMSQMVHGELDWIAMKALEKDRSRRYESASALAADIARYLADEPVEACPPSALYRFGKFARRNRAALSSATLVTVALLLGTAVSVWQGLNALRAQIQAETNLQGAMQVLDEVLLREVAENQMMRELTVSDANRELLLTILAYYERFAKANSHSSAVRFEQGKAYDRVGQIRVSLGERKEAEKAFLRAIQLLERLSRQHPQKPEYRHGLAEACLHLAATLVQTRRLSECDQRCNQAVSLLEKLVANFPDDSNYQNSLAKAYNLREGGRTPPYDRSRAERDLRRVVQLNEALAADYPEVAEYHMGHGYGNLGRLYERERRFEEAEAAFLRKLEMAQGYVKKFPHHALRLVRAIGLAHLYLGRLYGRTGQRNKAEEHLRQSMANYSRLCCRFPSKLSLALHYGTATDILVDLLIQQGQSEQIERILDRWFDELPETGFTYYSRGRLLQLRLKRHDAALLDYEQAIKRTPNYAWSYRRRAQIHYGREEYQQALENYDQAIQLDVRDAKLFTNRARTLEKLGKLSQALADYEASVDLAPNNLELNRLAWFLVTCPARALRDADRAVELAERLVKHAKGPHLPQFRRTLVVALRFRAEACAKSGQFAKALRDYERCADVTSGDTEFNNLAWFLATCPDSAVGDAHRAVKLAGRVVERAPENPVYLNTLGVAHYRGGHLEAAVVSLKKAASLAKGDLSSLNGFFLAMALRQLGHQDQARKWYERAVERMQGHDRENDELIRFRKEAERLLRIQVERSKLAEPKTESNDRKTP